MWDEICFEHGGTIATVVDDDDVRCTRWASNDLDCRWEDGGSECLAPFCREVFDSPMELEEHRHLAHPELYEDEREQDR